MAAATTLLKIPCMSAGEVLSGADIARDTMRPQFHLLPAAGWMNDPNGPIYAHGHYHLFCQHNPKGATWGNMSWAHMVSLDMVHWRHLPLALSPDPEGIDSYGVFSGSCFPVGKRVYAVYTATAISDAAHATTHGNPNIRESQRLAYSDDPMLLRWTKQADAIVPAPPPSLREVTGFRDPSIWRQGDNYYMTVGAGETGVGGCVLLYQSPDLRQWTYLHKLAEGDWRGTVQEDKVSSGEMWECPDFFALDGAHVLIYSTAGKVYWQSGHLDEEGMRFHPNRIGLLDLGAYYAPKTQLDANGNRILWGWIPERRPVAASVSAGWSGVMSLPRVLHLDRDGNLQTEVLPALKQLRGPETQASRVGPAKKLTLQGSNGEAWITGVRDRKLVCVVRQAARSGELARVEYDPEFQVLRADGIAYPISSGQRPTMHLFADGSVLEFILSGQIGFTKRFYAANAPDLSLEIEGAEEAVAWHVRAISPDRLTTAATA